MSKKLFGNIFGSKGQTPVNTNGQVNGHYATPASSLIELRQVVKQYTTPLGEFTALKSINLTVERGKFVAVVGKSGSGKSTLINMITGIDKPSAGEVLVDGVSVHTLKEEATAKWRGRNVGIIFQFFQLLPLLSCIENVMLPMDLCDTYSREERRERAWQLLQQVDMAGQANKLPAEVSGGQQQRVARALANDPPILVADEPTGNLDSQTAASVVRLFETLIEQGKTILMVTHDNDLARRATQTIVISDGEIASNEWVETPTAANGRFQAVPQLVA